MTSLTGGFAPIAGAGASKDKGSSKKNDLTGGLISLGGGSSVNTRSKNDDLDFSDFDVDDLLLDDAGGGSKSKSKGESKSKSPTASPKKKKSNGTSDGSSSKKKKDKEKKKKQSGGSLDFLDDDGDDRNDWDKDDDDFSSSTKKSTKAFDLDELLVPAKKKNAKLDDEFARMLGLEDDIADRNTTMSSLTNEEGDVSEYGDSPVKREAYAPTKSRSEPLKTEEAAPPQDADAGTSGGTGGLDASFFDEPASSSSKATSGEDDFLSFLSSTTSSDRRGGRGAGGRRGAGAASSGGDDRGGRSLFADPFEKNDSTSSRRAGRLDDLFSSSSSRGVPKPENVLEAEAPSATTKAPAAKSTFASLFGSTDASKAPQDTEDDVSVKPIPRSLSSKPVTSTTNAKDDLLAELFPSETPRPPARKEPSLVKDESAQQDDLLAELFPVEAKKQRNTSNPDRSKTPSPPRQAVKPAPEPKALSASPPVPARTAEIKNSETSVKSAGAKLTDVDSARDSLLKDLLPDSPPRQRRSSTHVTDVSDNTVLLTQEKTATDASGSSPVANGKTTLSAEPSPPPKPPIVKAPVAVEPSPPRMSQPSPVKSQLAPAIQESPLPSPGKTKTLTIGTPSKLREVEFEQSKDDLLEEILSSAPPSPLQRSPDVPNGNMNGPISPRSRRSSYSLSFDHDVAVAEEPLEPPPPTGVPARRRASRSPEKQEPLPPTTAAAVAAAAVPQTTVFLRDINAEEELKKLHAAAIADLEARHAEAIARATTETQQLESRLHQEQANAVAQASICDSHKLQLQHLRDELADARAAYGTLISEMQALQNQHSLQKTQCELFDREKAALLRQISLAEDQQRTLVAQLAQEKLSHQQTQLAFADFKRETEQAAQLRTEKERAQMDRLYHQLQNSLAQLTVLQEQGSEEAAAKRELEAATRLRMINSLETTSRGYAQQTQDECHRLTSLMSSLETTLRAFRQEHLEEKERLRQEQMRLNVLAQHFQAQTSVLNEKSDANAQLLAQHLGASLQDTRTAEARLAVRRQQLADDEQKLYNERAIFASHREAWLEQRQRETAELEAQRSAIEREWRALQRERDDLEDVIASHEDAFRALQQQQLHLEAEKDRVAVGALHVAEMAQKFELLTKQLVDKEHAMQQQRAETEELQRQWAVREQNVASERRKLDEREVRLHAQLKQMEASRRKMNDERRQQLQQMHVQQRERAESTTCRHASSALAAASTDATVGGVRSHVMLGSGNKISTSSNFTSPPPSVMQFTTPAAQRTQQQHPTTTSAWDVAKAQQPQASLDPSGFSPSFRQLVEENWCKQPRVTAAALHKERMAIHCLGLDTRGRRDAELATPQQRHYPTASPVLPTKATNATVPNVTTGSVSVSRSTTRPPPPSSSSSVSSTGAASLGAPRALSVHL